MLPNATAGSGSDPGPAADGAPPTPSHLPLWISGTMTESDPSRPIVANDAPKEPPFDGPYDAADDSPYRRALTGEAAAARAPGRAAIFATNRE